MSNIKCPKCNTVVKTDNLNISANIGKCDSCDTVFSISETIETNDDRSFDMSAAPEGAQFVKLNNGFQIIASTKSKMAIFLIPFTLVWAGFSLSGIYGSQIMAGTFNFEDSLFGIPFLIGSIILISLCLLTVRGKVIVTANGFDGWIFTGVGKVGWTRKFNWKDFDSVEEGLSSFHFNHQNKPAIFLTGKNRIGFGTWLNDERRYFVINCIKQVLSFK